MFDKLLSKDYYGNTVLEWITALGICLASLIAAKIVYKLVFRVLRRSAKRTETSLDDIMLTMIEGPVVFAMVIIGIYYGVSRLTLSEESLHIVDRTYFVLTIFNVAWLLARILDALIEEYVVPHVKKTDSDLDDQLLPLIRKGLRLTIWVIAVIMGLDNAGFDVLAVLAGLGVGGLALALAAQDTMSNFFGGISIFLDKPFKVGDRIQVEGYDGVVTDLGIRSTRIESRYEGRSVIIPNRVVANADVVNVTSEDSRQIFNVFRLKSDLATDKVEHALKLLKEIAKANQNTEDLVVTALLGISEYSNDVSLLYWIKSDASNLKTRTQINFEIKKQFEGSGIEFVDVQKVHAKYENAVLE